MNTTRSILTFSNLTFAQKVRFIKEILGKVGHENTVRYRNTTGRVIVREGELIGRWNGSEALIDAFNIKYVMLGTGAYTEQMYFYFIKEGVVVKRLSRDVIKVLDKYGFLEAIIEKQDKSGLEYDEVKTYIFPIKRLDWSPEA